VRDGRFPLAALLPFGAFLAAFWASFPALDIWSHILTGQMYDPWRDSTTAHAVEYAIARAGLVIVLALLSLTVKEYRKAALIAVALALIAVTMVPLGLRFVRILPDG
jgi:hypothetical protein